MFDKNLYIETFSALHASEDTLAEIQAATSQYTVKRKRLVRPAFVFALASILTVSSAVLAAGSRMMGGWIHDAPLEDVEKMGLHYPKQLGEYHLSSGSPFRIHVAPSESSGFLAWLNPDYTWMGLDYENDASRTLSISFGKTDDPLWAYCFSYNEATGVWNGAENPEEYTSSPEDSRSYIENVTEYVYEGCTIYLADRITEYLPENEVFAEAANGKNTAAKAPDKESSKMVQITEAEAHWVDSEIGLCLSVSSGTERLQTGTGDPGPDAQGMTQKEMLKYVKSIIDGNRP